MANLDLTTSAGVLSYLENTPFSSDNATTIIGGYGNYVFRLRLHVPYESRTTLVLKHGKPYLPGNETFAFAIERQSFEVGILKRIKDWLPSDSLVTVPVVHLFDDVANVIVMDDCGEGVKTLKQIMLDAPPSFDIAQQIGTELGQFLARFHSWASSDENTLAYLSGNHQARSISAYATYARLISTLKGVDAPPSMRDPVLNVPVQDLETIEQVAKQMTNEIMVTKETLVMGDFWPGNILIVFSSGDASTAPTVQRIFVLDWELAKPGIAGLDVGQFCAEMHLLRRCRPHCAESSSATISAFQRAYKGAREGLAMERVARDTLVHIGAHLVAWTPRNDWGDKEKTRELACEGVNYLIAGGSGTDEDMRKSLAGELLL